MQEKDRPPDKKIAKSVLTDLFGRSNWQYFHILQAGLSTSAGSECHPSMLITSSRFFYCHCVRGAPLSG